MRNKLFKSHKIICLFLFIYLNYTDTELCYFFVLQFQVSIQDCLKVQNLVKIKICSIYIHICIIYYCSALCTLLNYNFSSNLCVIYYRMYIFIDMVDIIIYHGVTTTTTRLKSTDSGLHIVYNAYLYIICVCDIIVSHHYRLFCILLYAYVCHHCHHSRLLPILAVAHHQQTSPLVNKTNYQNTTQNLS